jgi:transcription elongation factor Elf1
VIILGRKKHVTISEALKDTLSFFFGGSKEEESKDTEEEMRDNPDGLELTCPRCKAKLFMVNQLVSEFLTMVIYRCPECGVTKEVQFDQENGNLMKDVTIYNQFAHSSSSYMEIINECNYNEFALDRLWEVSGTLCYPVLMKTQFSDNVDLVFIRVQDDLSHNSVDGYIVTDGSNMLGKVKVQKTDVFSYFLNPYLYRLPHSTFMYASTPIQSNENIAAVSPIRYRFKVSSMKNSYLCELSIIEDFPVQSFGVELFVKFGSFTDLSNTALIKIIKLIDINSIIMGKDPVVDDSEGIFIQQQWVHKINLYSSSARFLTKELREHFCGSIKKFFIMLQ